MTCRDEVSDYWVKHGLSGRVAAVLAYNGVATIAQLRALGRVGVNRCPNMGPVGLREIGATIGWGGTIGRVSPAGRLALRTAAREMLNTIDGQTAAEARAAGWTVDELDALETIAAWPVDGVPFGDWVENPTAERVQRDEPAGAP